MKIKYLFFLLLTGSLLFSTSCKKEDAKIETMIVGIWQTRKGASPREYHVMEFTSDGRYRDVQHGGSEERNVADIFTIGGPGITFDDSIHYTINNSKSILDNKYPIIYEICWIRRNWMKIKDSDGSGFRYKRR